MGFRPYARLVQTYAYGASRAQGCHALEAGQTNHRERKKSMNQFVSELAAVGNRADASIAQRLAGFATGLRHEDVPAEARRRVVLLMLDAIGIALACTRYDFAHRMLSGIASLDGNGDIPVIGMAARLPWRDAIVMNAYLAHGLDFDDTHVEGVVHPTAAAMPTALVLAAQRGRSGQDAVTAYIASVEAAVRVGAAAKGGFHQVGYHPTGLANAFGCALAAARLMDLTAEQAAHAQGIVLSMAGGSLEFLEDGAWTKRMHPGWAGMSGATAAALARQGFRGPALPYEGRFGLYNMFLQNAAAQCDLPRICEGLGQVWEVAKVAVKPLPACHFAHASADAAAALAQRHGLTAADVERLELLVPQDVVKVICEPEAQKRAPANPYEAQFSVHYLAATAFLKGGVTLRDLEPDAIADPAVLELMQRTGYRVDPDAPFPKYFSGEAVVHTRDGRTLSHREEMNRGCADRPLTAEDIVAKFMGNATLAVSTARAEAIRDAVLELDDPLLEAAEILELLAG